MRIKRRCNGMSTRNETLIVIRPRVFHVLASAGDNKLMIYKIVNCWPSDDYSIIQQLPVAHLVAKSVSGTKCVFKTREIRAKNRNYCQRNPTMDLEVEIQEWIWPAIG